MEEQPLLRERRRGRVACAPRADSPKSSLCFGSGAVAALPARREQTARDDQYRATHGGDGDLLAEHPPAHQRSPDERGIFNRKQNLRLGTGIGPGKQQQRYDREQCGHADPRPMLCRRHRQPPRRRQREQPEHEQILEEGDLERLGQLRLVPRDDEVHRIDHR